jgi:starch synthase
LPHATRSSLIRGVSANNILILGSGNTAIENQLNSLLSQDYKGGNIVVITKISALIYTGSDFY